MDYNYYLWIIIVDYIIVDYYLWIIILLFVEYIILK